MKVDRRAFFGPALTTAVAIIAIVVDRDFLVFFSLAPLFVSIAVLAASLSGTASGLVSAAIASAFAALFLPDRADGFDGANLPALALLALSASGAAVITGMLRQKFIGKLTQERAHHATADRLSAALDEVNIGIVLLNSDTRAEFINRAFRDYFSLSDEEADSKPPFIALMYHGRDTGAFELPEDELSSFISARMEMMRAGDSTPIDINLADGQVLRFSCTALPDGGRMLSYTPVTDLVRHTDDLGSADYFRSLRGNERAFIRHLSAAE
jgi:PAS domain-containing protein